MKQRKLFTAMLALLSGGMLSAGLTACNPEEPENEITKKLHENPSKAVISLQEGVWPDKDIPEYPKMEDFTPASVPASQVVWEVRKGQGWVVTSPEKELRVRDCVSDPGLVYSLRIDYYNAEGKLMNAQFIEQGQDKIHQHFFCMYRPFTAPDGTTGSRRVTDRSGLPFDYRYADSHNGQYMASSSPMGFQGLIRFLEPDTSFNLHIELLHAPLSKLETDGTPSPFYLPSKTNLSTGLWDIILSVPVRIGEQEQRD